MSSPPRAGNSEIWSARRRKQLEVVANELREKLLQIPNIPAPDVPEGFDENDNVETRRWWAGMDRDEAFPTF